MSKANILFKDAPGIGKTETAKQVAQILGRELYAVSEGCTVKEIEILTRTPKVKFPET